MDESSEPIVIKPKFTNLIIQYAFALVFPLVMYFANGFAPHKVFASFIAVAIFIMVLYQGVKKVEIYGNSIKAYYMLGRKKELILDSVILAEIAYMGKICGVSLLLKDRDLKRLPIYGSTFTDGELRKIQSILVTRFPKIKT